MDIVYCGSHKNRNLKTRFVSVNMRETNLAIKRTRYIIPTVDDPIVDLNGANFFSKFGRRIQPVCPV